ncbi:helix-turn-helix domain-containing protein [Streptomyces coeruleorubidus]
MTNDGKARPLSAIIGERLRLFREDRGLRQADIAAAAAASGLKWSRSSIAALEAGTRNLSIEELLLLPYVVMNAGGWDHPLVPPDVKIWSAEGYHFTGDQLGQIVGLLLVPLKVDESVQQRTRLASGENDLEQNEVDELGSVESYRESDEPLQRARYYASHVAWMNLLNEKNPRLSVLSFAEDPVNPEYQSKVAERLVLPWSDADSPMPPWHDREGRTRWDFALYLPWLLWGRNAEQERDARTDARGEYGTRRSLQAARGHATRDMITELNKAIQEIGRNVGEYFRELHSLWNDPESLNAWARRKSAELHERTYGHPDALGELEAAGARISPQVLENLPAVGAVLRSARERAGMTLEELASDGRISVDRISGLESGRAPATWNEGVLKAGVRHLARKVGEDPAALTAALEWDSANSERAAAKKPWRWRAKS